MKAHTSIVATLGLLGVVFAQEPAKDPFPREGNPEQRAKKDPLEGKPPPSLVVGGWLNVDKPVVLADLRGKVVLIDFWGTW